VKIVRTLTRISIGMIFSATLPAIHASASYITIVPTFDSTITGASNAAAIEGVINNAISIYDSTLTTPIALTVSIDFQEGTASLGESSTTLYSFSYASFRAALTGNSSGDATDLAALASTPGGTNNPVNGTSTMFIKTANARALGLCTTSTCPSTFDGTISLETTLTNPGNTGTSGQYSLLAVVEHEIDEVLGLGSNLNESTLTSPAPQDLFRYSAPGTRSYTTAGAAYFSVNGGVTNLISYNNVANCNTSAGDCGDWASSATPHVQDAFATPGATPSLNVELTALDAIGYNLATPEPGTFVLGGAGLVGAFLLRRRRA
jgi:hypothetical protein